MVTRHSATRCPFEADGLPSQPHLHELFLLGMTGGQADGRLFHKVRPLWIFRDESYRFRWNKRYAGEPADGYIGNHGYRITSILESRVLVHRIVFKMVHSGLCPVQIDHDDGNPLNNHISNLKASTNRQNGKNMKLHRTNTSGVCGVYWYKATKKWAARIYVDGKWVFLGYYASLEDATRVRKQAERDYGFHPRHGTPFTPASHSEIHHVEPASIFTTPAPPVSPETGPADTKTG